jgi:hypothetical protein
VINIMNRAMIRKIVIFGGISVVVGGLITYLMDNTDTWWLGWLVSSLMLGASFAILYFLYKKAGSAKILGYMIAVSFLLRLGLGVALMKALPVAGYGTDQQKAGYVFYDAYRRDGQAIEIAQSHKPIWTVFSKQYATDQYGGYLGLSVIVYRLLSANVYRPYLMLILSALAAAMGVPFLWMILSRFRDGKWHKFAGWLYVLYPEAVLLGASQMREPYLITFMTIVFWAALEWQQTGNRSYWAWLAGGLIGLLLFSPGIAVLSLIIIPVWIWLDRRKRNISWWIFPTIFAVLLIGLILLAYGLARQGHFANDSPIEIILNWFRNASAWDVALTQGASGQLDFQLKSLPEWMKVPFITAYGLLQPVLPATIMDTSIWLWRTLTSYLAIGWYLLLPLIVYGTVAAFFETDKTIRTKVQWLAVVIWSWIIISSARAGGDMWDNPRYRTIILIFIVIFAAWSWERARQQKFVWLKRIALVEGIFLLFFMEWYAARYYQIFVKLPFFTMIGLIIGFSMLVIIGGIFKDRVLANREKQSDGRVK